MGNAAKRFFSSILGHLINKYIHSYGCMYLLPATLCIRYLRLAVAAAELTIAPQLQMIGCLSAFADDTTRPRPGLQAASPMTSQTHLTCHPLGKASMDGHGTVNVAQTHKWPPPQGSPCTRQCIYSQRRWVQLTLSRYEL